MFTLPAAVRIYVAAEAVDLRRGFDGLAAATRSVIGADPLSGHVFVFLNRRKNRVKLLVWDRTGYLLLYNGLSVGPSRYRRFRHQVGATWNWTAARWGSCSRGGTCAGRGAGRGGTGRRRRRPA